MTVIAGKVLRNGKVELGADTQHTFGTETLRGTKLVVGKGFVIGGAGLSRYNQFMAEFAPTYDLASLTQQTVRAFLQNFEAYAKGLEPTYREEDSNHWLIGCGGKLVHSAGEIIFSDYYALGSGGIYARTVLAMGGSVKEALRIACEKDIHCSLPITLKRA